MSATILAFPTRNDRDAALSAHLARVARLEAEDAADTAAIGPWFADVACAISGERYSMADTLEAKIIRRCLRELAGVTASVRVRRYSMASGLDLSTGTGERFTDAQAARIAAVFPFVAWAHDRRDDDGVIVSRWTVADGIYPHARADKSDLQSDYHSPGGFRVANAYLLQVSAIVSAVLR